MNKTWGINILNMKIGELNIKKFKPNHFMSIIIEAVLNFSSYL